MENKDSCNDAKIKYEDKNDGILVVNSTFDNGEKIEPMKVKVKLYKLTGISPQLEEVKETDEHGNCTFEGLSFGYYRLIESIDRKKIKVKYLPWNEFEINSDNIYVVVNIKNRIKKNVIKNNVKKETHSNSEKPKEAPNNKSGSIIVKSVIGKTREEPLSGVVIEMYKLIDNNIELLGKKKTNKEGIASFTNVPNGNYVICEKINLIIFKPPCYIESQIVSINDQMNTAHILIMNMIK